MTAILRPGMRGIAMGDSIFNVFGGCASPLVYINQGISDAFGGVKMPAVSAPFVPPVYKMPVVARVNTQAGRECKTIAGTGSGNNTPDAPTFKAFLATNFHDQPYDFAFFELGINDADSIRIANTTLAVALACQAIIMDVCALPTTSGGLGIPYSQMVWAGPWGHDSGDDLAQIALLDSPSSDPVTGGFRGQVESRGGTYVQWSVNPNTPVATYTSPNNDGTHPNTLASSTLLGPQFVKALRFTP